VAILSGQVKDGELLAIHQSAIGFPSDQQQFHCLNVSVSNNIITIMPRNIIKEHANLDAKCNGHA
jgi:hypothetical protein